MKFITLFETVVTPVDKILQKYRVMNTAWSKYVGQAGRVSFTAEMSVLSHSLPIKDPWNRPLPMNTMVAQRDLDGDIMFWRGETTIESIPIPLTIYND